MWREGGGELFTSSRSRARPSSGSDKMMVCDSEGFSPFFFPSTAESRTVRPGGLHPQRFF